MKFNLFLLFTTATLCIAPLNAQAQDAAKKPAAETQAAQTGLKTTDIIFPNKTVIKAELADTEATRTKGLMHRNKLEKNTGMLFVNEKEDFVAMWMKNTWVDLDFIYISANKKVTTVFKNIKRTYEDTPENKIPVVYFWAKYVLEVPAGTVDINNIKQGDVLEFEYPVKEKIQTKNAAAKKQGDKNQPAKTEAKKPSEAAIEETHATENLSGNETKAGIENSGAPMPDGELNNEE